jgi:hypothetical protein
VRVRSEQESDREKTFTLAFVDRTSADVCTIKELTEGEARWIGDVVLRERPRWFR